MIDDQTVNAKNVKRVLFCSGKVYYDLLDKQQKENRKDVALVRVEQIYPKPEKQLQKIAEKYNNATEFVWVQEEPENMGAWPFMCREYRKSAIQFEVVSRVASSSTATGYAKQHAKQQQQLVDNAFDLNYFAINAVVTKKSKQLI